MVDNRSRVSIIDPLINVYFQLVNGIRTKRDYMAGIVIPQSAGEINKKPSNWLLVVFLGFFFGGGVVVVVEVVAQTFNVFFLFSDCKHFQ